MGARAGAEIEAADAVRSRRAGRQGARADADLEAEELAIVEDEEPSADDEVDLATGEDDLGVETPARTTKARERLSGGSKFPFSAAETSPKARRDGAVAQLGERRNGIAKVRGSIPLGSTILLNS